MRQRRISPLAFGERLDKLLAIELGDAIATAPGRFVNSDFVPRIRRLGE